MKNKLQQDRLEKLLQFTDHAMQLPQGCQLLQSYHKAHDIWDFFFFESQLLEMHDLYQHFRFWLKVITKMSNLQCCVEKSLEM